MTQIRGHGVHARPAAALGAAGIDVEYRVPGLPLLTGFHRCRRRIVLDAMFAAEYVEVTENNACNVRRSVRLSIFTLKKKKKYVANEVSTAGINIAVKERRNPLSYCFSSYFR